MYKDRRHAGVTLAVAMTSIDMKDPLVLGIPRGGVVVAREVAEALGASMDVVLAKKIGAPYNPEFAIAAVDPDGKVVMGDIPYGLEISRQYVEKKALLIKAEIDQTLAWLRGMKKEEPIQARTVCLVDDGLATGLTAVAALKYLRRKGPGKVVLAVPVAPPDTLDMLGSFADEIICPLQPSVFRAVGEWYSCFQQVPDRAVRDILQAFA